MDSPRRLLDDPEGSALSRALLASAQADIPSSKGRARVARRLGIAAILSAGAGLGSEAGALVVTCKLTAVVLALGGVVGLAVLQSPPAAPEARPPLMPELRPPPAEPRHHPTPSALPPASTAASPAVSRPAADQPRAAQAPAPTVRAAPVPPPAAVAAAHAPSPPSVPVAPAMTEPAARVEAVADEATLPEASDGAPPGPPEEAAPPVPQAASPSRLAAEVALVDRARGRLSAGDHVAALAALAEYHQRFASGDLDAEAEVVMIETLIAMREVSRARALGAAFLVRFPRSPLAQRVHSLLERLPN